MSTLWFVLTPLLVTWFPAGYLTSRVWNALGFDCELFSNQASPRNNGKDWGWNRPIMTDSGQAYFGLGVVLGWITVALFVYSIVAVVVIGLLGDLFKALGHRLMPS